MTVSGGPTVVLVLSGKQVNTKHYFFFQSSQLPSDYPWVGLFGVSVQEDIIVSLKDLLSLVPNHKKEIYGKLKVDQISLK